jgi:hypothetical protein
MSQKARQAGQVHMRDQLTHVVVRHTDHEEALHVVVHRASAVDTHHSGVTHAPVRGHQRLSHRVVAVPVADHFEVVQGVAVAALPILVAEHVAVPAAQAVGAVLWHQTWTSSALLKNQSVKALTIRRACLPSQNT